MQENKVLFREALEAPHMSFNMTLSYITSKLREATEARTENEEDLKKTAEKSML